MTMALLPGSPAIDAGLPVEGITSDQRGISRTDYGPPDIGAYEYGAYSTMSPIVVMAVPTNAPTTARSPSTFNQATNLHGLIDTGPSPRQPPIVQLFHRHPIALEATAATSYDRDTFTLTIDLRLTGSQKTMLEDGRYQAADRHRPGLCPEQSRRSAGRQRRDSGRACHRRVPPVGGRLQRQWGSRRGRQNRLAAALRLPTRPEPVRLLL